MLWSFETFADLAVRSAAAVCSLILYVFFASRILPELLLKPRYNRAADGDRGVRRFVFEEGRAVLYEPCGRYRPYLKQYILSVQGEKKYVRCQFGGHVHAAVYDIIVFAGDGSVIDTVTVRERIFFARKQISRAVLLPEETAYVKLVLRAVNGSAVGGEKLFVVSSACLYGFAAIVTIGLAAVSLLWQAVLSGFALQILGKPLWTGDGAFAVLSALAVGPLLSYLLCRIYKTRLYRAEPRKKRRFFGGK